MDSIRIAALGRPLHLFLQSTLVLFIITSTVTSQTPSLRFNFPKVTEIFKNNFYLQFIIFSYLIRTYVSLTEILEENKLGFLDTFSK